MTPDGFHWREAGSVRILVPGFFDLLNLCGGYSTRASSTRRDLDCDCRGGKAAEQVLENRRLVAAAMEVDAASFVFAEQVHSNRATAATSADRGRGARSHESAVAATDALVTTDTGLPLAILAADCAVVLLADENRRAVAAVHCGRRGAVLNVAASAAAALANLGVAPAGLYASIGPAICQSCYEVGPEVAAEFERAFPRASSFLKISSGRAHLDLSGIVRSQLADLGVRADRVFDAGLCTACQNELFFSYRREREGAGRCMGVICLAL